MRSPVLIAQTPFAQGHGPRFLAPPGRGVDRAAADHFIGRVREEEADVEEVEGDDYLAVQMALADDATGESAPQILVLAGIDANRMTSEERDEVLEQLRERLEVLNDAVAAIDWTVHGHDLVIEIPELEEWHEAGWDVLPRTGRWANDSAAEMPAPPGDTNVESKNEPEPEPDDRSEDPDENERSESHASAESRADERLEDAGDPFHFKQDEATKVELAATPPKPEPARPAPEPVFDFSAPILPVQSPPEPAAVKVNASPPKPVAEFERKEPEPSLGLKEIKPIAPVASTTPARPAAAAATEPSPRTIDPIKVSESVDRSAALAPVPPKPTETTRNRPIALRWWVWGPWTAVAVLLVAKYLYLTQVDKTWNQRVSESHYAVGPTKVVEMPVDKPAAIGETAAWSAFVEDFRGKLSRGELVAAAERLHAWSGQVATMTDPLRKELTELQGEFRGAAVNRLEEWATGRSQERRFADAYAGLSAFAADEAVKAVLDPAVAAGAVGSIRGQIRLAEDEYHYTQIRMLAAAEPVSDEKLKQHIDAYLALVEPPGRMLADVQKLADYRKWVKEGQPVKAAFTVKWGPRIAAEKHTIELSLWDGKGGVPLGTSSRTAEARAGQEWSETFAINGIAIPRKRIQYRVKTVRPTSAVEELTDGARERIELFHIDPSGAEREVESGTVVRFELHGLAERPDLPAWKDNKAPVIPVSLPKVGK